MNLLPLLYCGFCKIGISSHELEGDVDNKGLKHSLQRIDINQLGCKDEKIRGKELGS